MSLLLLLLDAIDLLIQLLAALLNTMYKLVTTLISLIFPLFYNQIVQQYENLQNEKPRSMWARHRYQIFITLCFFSVAVRCAAFAGALYTGNRSWQERELFLAFMNRRGSVDFNVYICFAALFTFLAYGHYLLYLSGACRTNWILLYDLLVRNEHQFREQFSGQILQELFNVEQLKELRYQKAFSKLIKDAILLVVTLWAVADDDPKWSFKSRLRHFGFLGTRCRVRALMCLLVCEVVISVAIFVIAFVLAIIFLFYLFLLIPAYSWLRAVFISADILHIGYLIFAIGRMLLSTLLSQLIVSISIGWHLHEQNGLLREQIGKIGHQYNRFHSYMALSFTVFNMPINAYLLAYLYYRGTLLDDSNIPIFAIFAIQLSVTAAYATSIIRMANAVHACRKGTSAGVDRPGKRKLF
ncbi:hypothetical protein TYRP_015250 [Tyrophagus putrescentiae]|nr:hypothetical protein TYRP_015250 [Tyrophagus putrescentiae]